MKTKQQPKFRQITGKRKKNEDASRKADELFLKIFNYNPIATSISNLESLRFDYVNEVFLTSFGYTKAEVIGKTGLELNLIEPEANEMVLLQLQQQGFAKDIEVLGRKKTGELFWTLVSVQVISLNDKKIALTSFIDITKRKKAEVDLLFVNNSLSFELQEKEKSASELIIANKELEKSKNFIKNLNQELERKVAERTQESESMHKNIADYKYSLDESCIVAVTDQKGIIQHVNDNFCKISKYTKAELLGQDHRIVNSGYHSKEFIRNLWLTIARGNIWKGEIKNKAKDGTTYWVNTTIVPFLDNDGKPYKYLAIRSDITEQKLSEDVLKKTEKKYRDIFENALVPIFISDFKTLKACDANQIAVDLFGYKSKADLLEKFAPENHFLSQKHFEEILLILLNNFELIDEEVLMKKFDGTLFWAKLFAKLNHDKSLIQIVIIDISSEKNSQNDLELKIEERTLSLTASLEREKEMNDMKSNFVSMASHEFRTPLTTILSSANLIEIYKEPGQQEQRLKHVQLIASSVKNLTEILTVFLSVGELENKISDIKTMVINLPEFLQIVIGELSGIVSAKKQKITYRHDGEEMIEQSGKILKNILLNLLSNALKYSPPKTAVQLSSSVAGNRVIITIKDYGIGIPEKDHSKLFTQFFRAANAENIQGTGLGLSIVKKYLELINGEIFFTSKINEGTIFTIEFPQNKKQQNKSISFPKL